MTALTIEKYLPYLAGLAVLGLWYFFGVPFPSKPDPLMGASGTVAAVLIGFLGTANAIVLGLTDSAVFKALKTSGYDQVLFRYFYEAEIAGVFFLIVSVIGFFLPENKPQIWFAGVWILTGGTAIALYFRTARLLFKLIKQA